MPIAASIAGAVSAAGAGIAGLGTGGAASVIGSIAAESAAKAMAALRDAGVNRLSEIRVKAALDPEFGKALLTEMPKKHDCNAAALIALRARQLSVAGVMAGVRQ